jgi:hypothetical protein
MRPENQRMKHFLEQHGIKATPRYIHKGSMRGCWMIYGKYEDKWSPALADKFNSLGFTDFMNRPFDEFSGNGGHFSIYAIGHSEFL